MIFVFPMAGLGSRFAHAGYTIPKYFIEVKGKTLLQYSIESLPIEIADKVIFIALKDHIYKYDLQKELQKYIPSEKLLLVALEKPTRGQAETVMAAKEFFDPENDLLIYNIDTWFTSKSLKEKLLDTDGKKDGVIGYFEDDDPKWSFAKINEEGFVTETAEKVAISRNALTGVYHFSRAKDFVEVAQKCISENILFKNEFYIAPMYNYLIASGKQFVLNRATHFVALGTPEDVHQFANQE